MTTTHKVKGRSLVVSATQSTTDRIIKVHQKDLHKETILARFSNNLRKMKRLILLTKSISHQQQKLMQRPLSLGQVWGTVIVIRVIITEFLGIKLVKRLKPYFPR